MDNNFEQPKAPPTGNSFTTPWDHRLTFKSGKVAQGIAAKIDPEDVKAGFSYYDKDAAQNVRLDQFTCIVVKVLAGVAGVTKEGDYYQNWYSNLVADTRSDILQVRVQGSDKVQFQGRYADFKADLPSGVGYSLVFLIYCVESKKYFALGTTVGLQSHLKNVIAKATNSKPSKVSLYNLCDLTTQYWGFKFTGNLLKVDVDGNSWDGKGEMYFMPECTCFTINQKPETEDWFALLGLATDRANEYLNRSQEHVWKSSAPAVKRDVEPDYNFPDTEPPAQPRSNAVQVEMPESEFSDLPF